ncbi:YeeE/YedE family protein [Janthinobacterium sp.]|uniref:YeeE/YedE family protein n=1 Tax=Janthinobacterium sp. TaxID=1871054 RepID=UPI00261C34F5|nr:YeeE/YedE family protein [Janthinobacterium sp.]
MQIDWQHFTPWSSLAGGLLIGLAAAVLILFNGRIAGISGIVGGLLSPRKGDSGWRIAFLAGLLLTPLLYQLRHALPEVDIEAGTPALVIAGLLVGLGVRYGAGCTSGHGVCGLSRLSPRSLVATMCFMAAGFLTVYVLRHGLAWT